MRDVTANFPQGWHRVDSLKFGTSGLRGLAVDLTGAAARRYTSAFIAHLRQSGALGESGRVLLGQDRRKSSAAIANDCARAIRAAGLVPVDCGLLPTPALALHGLALGAPAIMVTGSHVPADRNGLKFYTPAGEITKGDEAGITAALSDDVGPGVGPCEDGWAAAQDRYRQRYRGLLPTDALTGYRIGVFEHSSVAGDLLVSLLYQAGAGVVRLGRADQFVAVDTEAVFDTVFAPIQGWIEEHRLDALVSTDGDADRPLVVDAKGQFVRGDILGLVAAQFVGADALVTPITSNSAIEKARGIKSVVRTKVGSPYVIEGMATAREAGAKKVVGFEANGGTLLAGEASVGGKVLAPLPTRDAILPILALLGLSARKLLPVDEFVAKLHMRIALSDRLADVPMARTWSLLRRLSEKNAFTASYFAKVGKVDEISTVDGVRITLISGNVVHYRASGNAPELRCYVESSTKEGAQQMLTFGMKAAKDFVDLEQSA